MLAWVAVPLAFVALVMDWLDGYLARRLGCESKVGGVLDIVGDRIAENVWWVVFAWLHVIPLWVPIVVLSRGICDGCDSQLCPDQGFYGVWRVNDDEVADWVRAGCLAREPGDVRYFQGGRVCAVVQPECGATDAGVDACIFVLVSRLVAVMATYLTVALCVIRAIPVVTAAKPGCCVR